MSGCLRVRSDLTASAGHDVNVSFHELINAPLPTPELDHGPEEVTGVVDNRMTHPTQVQPWPNCTEFLKAN